MTILPSELGIEGTSSGFSQGLWFLSLPLLSLPTPLPPLVSFLISRPEQVIALPPRALHEYPGSFYISAAPDSASEKCSMSLQHAPCPPPRFLCPDRSSPRSSLAFTHHFTCYLFRKLFPMCRWTRWTPPSDPGPQAPAARADAELGVLSTASHAY